MAWGLLLGSLSTLFCAVLASGPTYATLRVRYTDALGNTTTVAFSDPSVYDPNGPMNGFTGQVRFIDSATMSPTVPAAPTKNFYVRPSPEPAYWIALSFETAYSFGDRALAAYLAGAGAAIIASNGASQTSPSSLGSIPCVSISASTGITIYSLLRACGASLGKNGSLCSVYVDVMPVATDDPVSLLVPQAAALAICIIFVTLCCCLYFRRSFCQCRRPPPRGFFPDRTNEVLARILNNPAPVSRSRSPAAQATIDALPVINVDESIHASCMENGDMCTICLDGFDVGAECRNLSCSHKYHKACIDPWLLEHGTCPLCKAVIVELEPDITDQPRLTDRQLYFLLLSMHLRRGRRLPPEIEMEYFNLLASLSGELDTAQDEPPPQFPQPDRSATPIAGSMTSPAIDSPQGLEPAGAVTPLQVDASGQNIGITLPQTMETSLPRGGSGSPRASTTAPASARSSSTAPSSVGMFLEGEIDHDHHV
eukprot:m.70489 g.70489  ORF g.70489 m.70489 type:complete len:482 (-) comp7596_c0_seq1:135-1580(-)